mgnify:FL=1
MQKRWQVFVALGLLLVLALIPKLIILPKVTKQLRAELQNEFQTDQIEVNLQAPWGWELLFGRLPGVELTMENAVVENLTLSHVEIEGEKIRLTPQLLWENWEAAYEGAERLEGMVIVTEEDLNTLLWEELDPEQTLHFVILPTGVTLNGEVSLFNRELDFTLHGRLEILQESNVRFVPSNLEIQATRVPPFLLEVLNQNYDLVVDFNVFPYPVTISEILMEDGQMRIKIGVIP